MNDNLSKLSNVLISHSSKTKTDPKAQPKKSSKPIVRNTFNLPKFVFRTCKRTPVVFKFVHEHLHYTPRSCKSCCGSFRDIVSVYLIIGSMVTSKNSILKRTEMRIFIFVSRIYQNISIRKANICEPETVTVSYFS